MNKLLEVKDIHFKFQHSVLAFIERKEKLQSVPHSLVVLA